MYATETARKPSITDPEAPWLIPLQCRSPVSSDGVADAVGDLE